MIPKFSKPIQTSNPISDSYGGGVSSHTPKPRKNISGAMVVAVAVFAITITVWVAFLLYAVYLTSKVEEYKELIASTRESIQPESISAIAGLEETITLSRSLRSAQPYYSDFFGYLEEILARGVYINSLQVVTQVSTNTVTANISAVASSINTLWNQVLILDDDALFADAVVSNIVFNENGTTSFSVQSTVDIPVFKDAIQALVVQPFTPLNPSSLPQLQVQVVQEQEVVESTTEELSEIVEDSVSEDTTNEEVTEEEVSVDTTFVSPIVTIPNDTLPSTNSVVITEQEI